MGLSKIANNAIEASSQYTGFKNRIINGAMQIDQRNAGASVSADTGGQYFLDRWCASISAGSKFTVQQNAGSVTPPAGFKNYLGVTSSTAWSIGASDYATINQFVEGFNVADLAWGTANAATVTLSFRVYSSLTGTFGGVISNSINAVPGTRFYPFTYSVSSANTWTTISVTIAGDTVGTWGSSNGSGIAVSFSLAAGSSKVATAGSWTGAAAYNGATGQTNILATNGATFYITGVQLEKGSTATSFDYRPYGTELALCQRYAVIHYGGTYGAINSLSSVFALSIALPVTMRAQPTFSTNISDSNFVVAAPSSTQWTLYQQNSGYSSYTGSINTISMNPTTSTQNWVQIGTYSCTLGAATAFQLGSSRYFSFVAEL